MAERGKLKGKTLKQLRRMFAPAASPELDTLGFGILGAADLDSVTAGRPKDVPGMQRAYMSRNGVVMAMSAPEARELARYFDSPAARQAGLADIAATLRELADECDLRNAGPGGCA